MTGTDLDYARCAVVLLDLAGNNLAGALAFEPLDGRAGPISLGGASRDSSVVVRDRGLRDLQRIELAGNRLSGAVPSWMAELDDLQSVDLIGNTFTYSSASFPLIDACASSPSLSSCVGAADGCTPPCAGLPPESCDAFAPPADAVLVVSASDQFRCHECPLAPPEETQRLALALMAGCLALALALAVIGALWSLRADSAAPRRWVVCISIVAYHVTSTATLCAGCRVWPAAVQRALACSLVEYACVADAQCLTTDTSLDLGAWLDDARIVARYSGAALVGCFLPSIVAALLECSPLYCCNCGVRLVGVLSAIGGALTVLLSGIALQRAVQLVHLDAGEGELHLAALLLLLVLVFQMKPLLEMELVHRLPTWRALVSPRIAFHTQRFAAHAPYWQFVQWGIHATLLALALSATASRAWGYAPVTLFDAEEPLRIGSHVASALVIAISWALHSLIEPYEFAYQNAVASYLHLPQLALALLAMAFEGAYAVPDQRRPAYVALEALGLLCVLGLPALALLFLMAGLCASGLTSGRTLTGNRGCRGCTPGKAELAVHSRAVPVHLGPVFTWTSVPLPAASTAVVSFDAPSWAAQPFKWPQPNAPFSPSAEEVAAHLRRASRPPTRGWLGGESLGRSRSPRRCKQAATASGGGAGGGAGGVGVEEAPHDATEWREREFQRCYHRLAERLLKPEGTRQLLSTLAKVVGDAGLGGVSEGARVLNEAIDQVSAKECMLLASWLHADCVLIAC